MLKETNEEMEKRWAKGYKKRQAHMMGPDQVIFLISIFKTIVYFIQFL